MTDWTGQKWEYHAVPKPTHAPMDDSELDVLGQWGWELVTVLSATGPVGGTMLVYTFKRPLPQAKIEMP